MPIYLRHEWVSFEEINSICSACKCIARAFLLPTHTHTHTRTHAHRLVCWERWRRTSSKLNPLCSFQYYSYCVALFSPLLYNKPSVIHHVMSFLLIHIVFTLKKLNNCFNDYESRIVACKTRVSFAIAGSFLCAFPLFRGFLNPY
jgi:hypothetical protein